MGACCKEGIAEKREKEFTVTLKESNLDIDTLRRRQYLHSEYVSFFTIMRNPHL